MTLTLRFGTARNGWLPLTLMTTEARFTSTVSHVLADPLLALVQASIGFLEGTDQEITLFEEPRVNRLVFVAEEPSGQLLIRQFLNHCNQQQESGVLVFAVAAPRGTIVRAFWRGLRELQSRMVVEQFASHWTHPFPQREMEQLTKRLNQR